jgi:hypothetical protein
MPNPNVRLPTVGDRVRLTPGSVMSDDGRRVYVITAAEGVLRTLDSGPRVHVSWCLPVKERP